MGEPEIKNLLLIGMDITSLAKSAKRAGYKVYAVDYFGDQDLRAVSDCSFSVIQQKEGGSCGRLSADFDVKALLEGSKKMSSVSPIDAILLSTGLDDSPEVLRELSEIAPILGNSPEMIQKVRDRERFTDELKRLGVPVPETFVVQDLSGASGVLEKIGYPIVAKPVKGFGGAGIRKIGNSEEFEEFFRQLCCPQQGVVIQEYIQGIAASVSVISSKNGSSALTVNEQLIGLSEFGQKEPFGYCGNIVPLEASEDIISRCRGLAERVVLDFELVGSNGVDLVISDCGIPYVVEVNPRFQGTLECLEKVLGLNIVEAHVKACRKGLLPKVLNTIAKFCTRLILFAPSRSVVSDLSRYAEVRDMSLPGVLIEEGEPVCSIIAEEKDRDSSFKKARNAAQQIFSSLKPI
jgi:predicted ATP-grasp superfamily ATP-dependent carboligase